MQISRIRVVPEDVAVWLVYAGYRRRHLKVFRETNSVFLELPGFQAGEATFQSDDLIRRHLGMSDAIRSWLQGQRSNAPSRSPQTYSANPTFTDQASVRSYGAEFGNIIRMFREAKPGDLVLCPPVGHFNPLLVGEIKGAWRKGDEVEVPFFQGEIVPARRVRWLNTAVSRHSFPYRVSKHLQNQHAISLIDPEFYEDILRVVYPMFVWQGESKIDIFGEKYTSDDPLQTYESALLIKYSLAAVSAYYDERFEEFQALNIAQAIETFYDADLVDQFRQNFNSPGKFSAVVGAASAAALVAAAVMVGSSDTSAPISQQKAEVRDKVQSALDGDNGDVSAELDDFIGSMEDRTWTRVRREVGQPARDKLGLTLNEAASVRRARDQMEVN